MIQGKKKKVGSYKAVKRRALLNVSWGGGVSAPRTVPPWSNGGEKKTREHLSAAKKKKGA